MPRKATNSPPDQHRTSQRFRPSSLWQYLLIPPLSILIFFLLLEGSLALFGVQPTLQAEDPFVGFAANVPLFIPSPGPDGHTRMTTAPNKKDYFNRQSFTLEKQPETFRIFSLGGSTTYGRPYDDLTSFSGWLRKLLPMADQTKKWEVINAGGISYASYRVANLMEELIRYQPDLFIVYTGHNEFLEERTYRTLKSTPPRIRQTVALLAKTRSWSAMNSLIKVLQLSPRTDDNRRFKLGTEVDAILDKSVGPERYSRDDLLRENILKHYRLSLQRIIQLARSVDAEIIFVNPSDNLKDCSPFKSQDTDGIKNSDRQRAAELSAMIKPLIWDKDWSLALQFLNEAAALNPRFAELHYLRGQALLALGRFSEAKKSFLLARDEDVCPLRAPTPIHQTLVDVTKESGVSLVDFVDLIEQRMQEEQGYAIPGREYFLDHVHPTITGHKLLAIALLETMADQGLARLDSSWKTQALSTVAAEIEGAVDQQVRGRALANLARVQLWAGKDEEAGRTAQKALENAGHYQQVAANAASTLSTVYVKHGRPERAEQLLYTYLAKAPNAVELRLQLGKILLDRRLNKLEEAAANLLLVCRQMPYYDWGHALFGITMAERGRPRIAYPSLMEAIRLNPNNVDANLKLAEIRPLINKQNMPADLPAIKIDHYPSGAPHHVVQGRVDTDGLFVADGIEVFFHENGRVKRFVDINYGAPQESRIFRDTHGTLNSPTERPHAKKEK